MGAGPTIARHLAADPMKILFVNSFYAPDTLGGAEVVLQSLVEGVVARGIEAAVLTTTRSPGLHRETVNGVTVWRAGIRNVYWHAPSGESSNRFVRGVWRAFDVYNPLMRGAVRTVIQAEQPTVASVHNLTGWSAALWSELLHAKVPVVQVLHDYQIMCRGLRFRNGHNCVGRCIECRAMRAPHKRLSSKLAGVAGVSGYTLNCLTQYGFFAGVPNRRVIYNARSFDGARTRTALAQSSVSRETLRFGYIGAIAEHKGVSLLLDSYLANPPAGSELLIAGSGEPSYVQRIRDRASGHQIIFLGRVAPSEFYPNVDVVVVPSLWNEPLATVVIEAMAYGKPVIASSVGGNPEMISQGINGLLFHPDRPDELTAAMHDFATSPELLQRLQAAAAERAAYFVDMDRFVDEHLALYSACSTPPPDARYSQQITSRAEDE